MRKIFIYIAIGFTALLSGCYSPVGGIFNEGTEFSQLVFINKCSDEVKVSISESSWISPTDTIVLKPECGLWKLTKYEEDFYFNLNRIEIRYGDREPLVYDLYADIPYNPTAYGEGRVISLLDSKGRYQVLEFTDERRDAIYKKLEERKNFSMFTFGYPEEILESFTVPGSSEASFHSVFPVNSLCDKLSLGAAVKKEAESVDKIVIVDDVRFTPSSVYEYTDLNETMSHYDCKKYYYLEHLQKASLANFGCDFVALTGRTVEDMCKKSGVAATKVYFDEEEYFDDVTAPENILAVTDDTAFINNIQYGNLMILLVESDLSPIYVSERLSYATLIDDLLGVEGIDYYLITLDENAQFVCDVTGVDALRKYMDGFDNPSIHPISFSTTDFSGSTSFIHVQDIVLEKNK